jgi:hypothetical protein
MLGNEDDVAEQRTLLEISLQVMLCSTRNFRRDSQLVFYRIIQDGKKGKKTGYLRLRGLDIVNLPLERVLCWRSSRNGNGG